MKAYIYEMSYLMANIKLPIEVDKDGTINPMIDHISIDINNCETLPDKVDISIIKTEFLEKIKNLLGFEQKQKHSPGEISDKLIISAEEIGKTQKSKSKNTTFKNYMSKKTYNTTNKNRG